MELYISVFLLARKVFWFHSSVVWKNCEVEVVCVSLHSLNLGKFWRDDDMKETS